ncbi:trypsin-like serine peptidase [Terrabacter sp. GCM10028922]|uniref:trypsin-like serine peptidase n=1 Tax=Terrabacter sp. GCM10028922 TaxID=3273428 RepID=UPI003619EC09
MSAGSVGSMYERLLKGSGGGVALESTGSLSAPVVDPDLQVGRLMDDVGYLEDRLGEHADPEALRRLTEGARHGLREVVDRGDGAQLGRDELAGLEAVVHSDGSRPVLFVEDDFVDLLAPAARDYAATLARVESEVRTACQAAGRVDDPGATLGYQGTAWAVGDGLVVTNYHVLQAISLHPARSGGTFTGDLKPGVTVDFGAEIGDEPGGRRFPVRRVVAVGPAGDPGLAHPSLRGVNFDGLDLAVLELEEVAGQSFPTPVEVARGDDPHTRGALASRGRLVYVVGFPGGSRSTTPDIFAALFAGVKGVKRLTPGLLTYGRGDVADDGRRWVIGHDASTLGGSSGSMVVDLEAGGRLVLGIHFAGDPGRVNWAHSLEGATQQLADAVPGW